MQRVVCAATRFKSRRTNVTIVIPSVRHWDYYTHAYLDELTNSDSTVWEEESQGFLDNKGNYLTRTEAWKVAKAAGQIIHRCGGDDRNGGTLYSENLY